LPSSVVELPSHACTESRAFAGWGRGGVIEQHGTAVCGRPLNRPSRHSHRSRWPPMGAGQRSPAWSTWTVQECEKMRLRFNTPQSRSRSDGPSGRTSPFPQAEGHDGITASETTTETTTVPVPGLGTLPTHKPGVPPSLVRTSTTMISISRGRQQTRA
jgi:hypothetical protein